MSRRMNVCVWGVLVALAVSSLCDSAEAGGRRRRARYCQPTCCQPRPVCCAPAPIIPEYFCAWYKAYQFGSVCYYYAPHCPQNTNQLTPITISATCNGFVYGDHCNDTGGPFCVWDGYPTVTLGLSAAATQEKHKKTIPHKNSKLKEKLPSDQVEPDYLDTKFTLARIGQVPNDYESGFYYVEFKPAGKPNYLAKCAQYTVYFDGMNNSETPESLILVAHGHEVERKNEHNLPQTIPGVAVAVHGVPNAYNVSIKRDGHPDITFLVFVTK